MIDASPVFPSAPVGAWLRAYVDVRTLVYTHIIQQSTPPTHSTANDGGEEREREEARERKEDKNADDASKSQLSISIINSLAY
jgi:hypothetical protein